MMQKLLLALAAVLSVVLTRADEDPPRMKRFKNLQVSNFDWKNCWKPDAPALLKTLSVSPDPIAIPGDLTAAASGSTSVELDAPLSLNVTLKKEVAGIWVKVPCLDQLGSCHYPDACDLLNQLIPPGQDCPEPLHTYGLPCHCPFKAGSYSLPQSEFYLPNVDLPYWLTNGKYTVQGVLGLPGQELGCLEIALSLHSD
ncbi:ganglioside GM2 activator [Oryzias melastigma]|uniref:Ganglioside GM2 activator n=1 Tax=Oryzias melastigma TaxID=30732 RepID=A0A3B3CS77_ORYME|nr:ganglioside GM2 activator [Oryzias melastigma]